MFSSPIDPPGPPWPIRLVVAAALGYPFGLALDSHGNAYVTGITVSTDFPTTLGAVKSTWSGTSDGFFFQLNATGSDLLSRRFWAATATTRPTRLHWTRAEMRTSRHHYFDRFPDHRGRLSDRGKGGGRLSPEADRFTVTPPSRSIKIVSGNNQERRCERELAQPGGGRGRRRRQPGGERHRHVYATNATVTSSSVQTDARAAPRPRSS